MGMKISWVERRIVEKKGTMATGVELTIGDWVVIRVKREKQDCRYYIFPVKFLVNSVYYEENHCRITSQIKETIEADENLFSFLIHSFK